MALLVETRRRCWWMLWLGWAAKLVFSSSSLSLFGQILRRQAPTPSASPLNPACPRPHHHYVAPSQIILHFIIASSSRPLRTLISPKFTSCDAYYHCPAQSVILPLPRCPNSPKSLSGGSFFALHFPICIARSSLSPHSPLRANPFLPANFLTSSIIQESRFYAAANTQRRQHA